MGAIKATHRADVNNAALSGRDHIFQNCLTQENLSLKVGVRRTLELLPGGILQAHHISAIHCVVHKNIDFAITVSHFLGKGFNGRIIRKIQ